MPIRLTCPSCSATLSVKDEYAGRAVKCPKCGGVIPASQPAAPPAAASPPPPPPAPAAAPEPAPFDDFDKPAKPANSSEGTTRPVRLVFDDFDEPATPAKPGGKITGKPTSRSKDADEDDEKPRRKGREDEDDRDARGKRGSRSERDDRDDKDEDGDRPAKRRRRDADDDDGPPGRGKKPEGKSNLGLILGIVGFLLLSCCGVGGYGIYYVIQKGKEGVENVQKQLGLTDNFAKVKVGTTTRAEAEALFGPGQPATMDELKKAYAVGGAPEGWNKLIAEGRALMWVNGEDRVFMAFHPNGNPESKVQRKNLVGKYVGSASDGELDDAKFVQQYLAGKGGDDLSGPAIDVSAEDICKAYKDNPGNADTKYKDKVVVVEGKLEAIDPQPDGTIYARLIGVGVGGAGGLQVRCVVPAGDVNKVYNCSRGQTIKFRGKCAGKVAIFVDVMSCKFESSGMDPSVTVTAAALINAYAGNEATADEKYKEKPITLTNATVESKTADAVYLVGTGKNPKSALKIKVSYAPDFRKQFESLKVGERVSGKVKGEGGGMFDGTIYLNGAWIVP